MKTKNFINKKFDFNKPYRGLRNSRRKILQTKFLLPICLRNSRRKILKMKYKEYFPLITRTAKSFLKVPGHERSLFATVDDLYLKNGNLYAGKMTVTNDDIRNYKSLVSDDMTIVNTIPVGYFTYHSILKGEKE